MAWPKGMPRKGHVNKDGTPHKKKGEKLAEDLRVQVVTKPKKGRTVQVVTKPDPTVPTVKKVAGPFKPTIASCPKCGEPDAFTYCDNCGWYRADPSCPHCRKGEK